MRMKRSSPSESSQPFPALNASHTRVRARRPSISRSASPALAPGVGAVIKFDGHYHGWSDPLYANTPWMEPIRSDPSAATHSVAGQPADADVTVTSWNDLSALERALGVGAPAAAVFMEPVPCNFGAVAPDAGYMAGVRRLCDEHGCLLVFDEVLTGFRLALGGAQERLDASPDLTVLSKAIASGFPIAMLVGTEDAMSPIVSGPMRPGGTFNGSPLSVAAAIATVDTLSTRQAEIYAHLDALGATLAAEIRDAARGVGAPLVVNQIGSVMQLFWGVSEPVRGYADAMRDDRGVVARLTARLLNVVCTSLSAGSSCSVRRTRPNTSTPPLRHSRARSSR